MWVLKRPSSLTFVLSYIAICAGLDLLIHIYAWPSILDFLLVAGPMAAALWYSRRTQWLTIAVYALFLAPTVWDYNFGVTTFVTFFVLGIGLQFSLTESIFRQVQGHARAKERLLQLLTHSPAVLYELTPGMTQAGGYQLAFISANADACLGINADTFVRPPLGAGLAGPTSDRQTWHATLDRTGAAILEYDLRRADGTRTIVRDECRVMRGPGGVIRGVVGQVIDITGQREAAAALVEGRRIQDETIRNSPVILFRAFPDKDRADGWRYVNHTANTIDVLGYSVAEVSADPSLWLGRIHPDDQQAVFEATRSLTAWTSRDARPVSYTYRFLRKDGTQIWLKESLRLTFDAQGRPVELFGQTVDVTTEHAAFEAQHQADARLRHIIEHSPLATYTLGSDLTCTFVTDNILSLTGFTAQDFVGQKTFWHSRIHPDDFAPTWERKSTPDYAPPPLVEYRFKRKDGVDVWLADTSQAIFDEQGNLAEIIGQVQDVTARKRAQLEAEESHRFISQLATAIPSHVFVTDANNPAVLYANRADALDAGWARATEQGDNLWETTRRMVHPDDLAKYDGALARVSTLCDDEIVSMDLRTRDAQDGWRDISCRYRVFKRDAAGRPSQLLAVWDDITESRQVARALADSQRLLEGLAQALPSLVRILDISVPGKPRAVYSNRALAEALGYPEPDLLELDAAEFLMDQLHPDDRYLVADRIQASTHLADGDVIEFEARVRAFDAQWRWYRVRARVFKRDADGRVTQVLGVMDDITTSRVLQGELAASQHLLSRVAQAVPGVLYVLSVEPQLAHPGGIVFSNQEVSSLLGYPAGLARQMGWGAFMEAHLHPEDLTTFGGELQKALTLADGAIQENEYRLRTSDGTWRWMRGRNLVFGRNPSGDVTEIIGLIEDVTVSKTLQNEVRAERDFAQLVLNGLGQGVMVCGSDGRCEYINPAGARILRTSVEAFVGTALTDVLTPDASEAILADWKDKPEGQLSQNWEIRVTRSEGEIVDLLVTASKQARAGQAPGAVVIFSDVTQRKSMEAALAQANRELGAALEQARALTQAAETANRAKSEFLANMSHEIRTPMNAIVGLAELLNDSPLQADQRNSIQMMIDSSQALLSLINDILDFSKIEAGKLELDRHEFNLGVAVEKVVDLVTLNARDKGLHLACWIDPTLPDRLIGDSGRLRQIVLNLLSNAVKFTSTGRVSVRAERVACPIPGMATVRVCVADTGIGIDAGAIARLFQPFVQAESGTTRRYGGTGLGLAIVRRLVDLMEGEVELESQPGVGTTVCVRLHFDEVTGTEPMILQGPAEGRILLVESDVVAREILETYVQAEGFEAVAVALPTQALTHLRVDTRFDAVLVGPWCERAAVAALLERLADDSVLGRLRIIVCEPDPAQISPRAETIAWPLRRIALHDALHPLDARSAETPVSATTLVPVTSKTRLRLLVAEDNPTNQKVATLQLEKEGYAVTVVDNGEAAVVAYTHDPSAYALILMDCQMPVLDGLEASRQIRAWEEQAPTGNRHVPILAMTANASPDDRAACLDAGMDGFLSKPVQRASLQLALAQHLLASVPQIRGEA